MIVTWKSTLHFSLPSLFCVEHLLCPKGPCSFIFSRNPLKCFFQHSYLFLTGFTVFFQEFSKRWQATCVDRLDLHWNVDFFFRDPCRQKFSPDPVPWMPVLWILSLYSPFSCCVGTAVTCSQLCWAQRHQTPCWHSAGLEVAGAGVGSPRILAVHTSESLEGLESNQTSPHPHNWHGHAVTSSFKSQFCFIRTWIF